MVSPAVSHQGRFASSLSTLPTQVDVTRISAPRLWSPTFGLRINHLLFSEARAVLWHWYLYTPVFTWAWIQVFLRLHRLFSSELRSIWRFQSVMISRVISIWISWNSTIVYSYRYNSVWICIYTLANVFMRLILECYSVQTSWRISLLRIRRTWDFTYLSPKSLHEQ